MRYFWWAAKAPNVTMDSTWRLEAKHTKTQDTSSGFWGGGSSCTRKHRPHGNQDSGKTSQGTVHTSVSGSVSALSEESSCQICQRSLCQSCHSELCGAICASLAAAELLCRGGCWESWGELCEFASRWWALYGGGDWLNIEGTPFPVFTTPWDLELGVGPCPAGRWTPCLLLRFEVNWRRGCPASEGVPVHTRVTGGCGLYSVVPGVVGGCCTDVWCLTSPWSPSRPSCELRELPSDMFPCDPWKRKGVNGTFF